MVCGLCACEPGTPHGDSAGEAAALNKLRKWNQTQNGLHAMLEFQNKLKKLGQEGREKFQFEHEMK